MIKALKRNTAFLYSRVQKRFVKTFLDRRQLSLVEGFDADSSNLFCKNASVQKQGTENSCQSRKQHKHTNLRCPEVCFSGIGGLPKFPVEQQ